jgi:hypothetical protein
MLGEPGEARDAYRKAAAMLEELGLELARAALTQIGVPLELLAGDPVAAELEARSGAQIFSRFGSEQLQAPLIAEALHAQGRFDEAARALEGVAAESGPSVAQWQARLRIVQARLATESGALDDAVDRAQASVVIAGRTDDLSLRADACSALAAALSAARRTSEGARALEKARSLYEAKGNVAALALLTRGFGAAAGSLEAGYRPE